MLHLDHIYYDGDVEVVRVELPRTRLSLMASDHLPLVAELRIGELTMDFQGCARLVDRRELGDRRGAGSGAAAAGRGVAVSARRAERWKRSRRRGARTAATCWWCRSTPPIAAAVTAAARRIEEAWGGIDVAIFNAGTHTPSSGDGFDSAAVRRTR